MKKSKQSAKSFTTLRNNHPLNPLFAQADYLRQLEAELNRHLSPQLVGNVHVTRFDFGQLHLQAMNSAFATQLRFSQSQLLNQLGKSILFNQLEKIHIKVRYFHNGPKPANKQSPYKISPSSAENLRTLADHVDHKELSHALRKLASRSCP